MYGPIYLYWLWLGAKSRSFFFVNAANPSITNGGFLMESKHEIYNLIPKQYYPQTVFLQMGTPLSQALQMMQAAGLRIILLWYKVINFMFRFHQKTAIGN